MDAKQFQLYTELKQRVDNKEEGASIECENELYKLKLEKAILDAGYVATNNARNQYSRGRTAAMCDSLYELFKDGADLDTMWDFHINHQRSTDGLLKRLDSEIIQIQRERIRVLYILARYYEPLYEKIK